jgi:hypothetical protein
MPMFRPAAQTNRVYGLDQDRLEVIIARALCLSRSQYRELQSWKSGPSKRDLAFFVYKVMSSMKKVSAVSSQNRNFLMGNYKASSLIRSDNWVLLMSHPWIIPGREWWSLLTAEVDYIKYSE